MAYYTAANKEMYATEVGYHNLVSADKGTTQKAIGIYLPRAIMEGFSMGVARTYLYELFDEDNGAANSESYYGLYDASRNPKPSANAIKQLTSTIIDTNASAATFTTEKLDFAISAGTNPLKYVLMQKSGGHFWLAVWRDVSIYDYPSNADITLSPLKVSATLTFNSSSRQIIVYADLVSPTTLATTAAGRSFSVNICPEITLIEIW